MQVVLLLCLNKKETHAMKALVLFLFLFLAVAASAQTIQTAEGRRMTAINTKIQRLTVAIEKLEARRKELLTEYTEESFTVRTVDAELAAVRKAMMPQQAERKVQLEQPLIRPLPKTQLELLKLW
jgi:uncharacterized lipoprotein YajG